MNSTWNLYHFTIYLTKLIQACETLRTPTDSKACRATFSSNNFCETLSVSHIIEEQLFFTTLLQFIEVCSIGLCAALLKSHHSISVKVWTFFCRFGMCGFIVLLIHLLHFFIFFIYLPYPVQVHGEAGIYPSRHQATY